MVKTTLPNGLTVLLQENHAAPVVAFQAWVHVGSADEEPDRAGIAHVFEHMLFKGTAKRGVGQIAQEVESAGGEINAWTSFDETVYHIVMASRFFDAGLDIISDAIQNSAFDAGELDRERKVILEEIKQGDDSPGRVVSQALFSTAYSSHPYRRPVIGSEKTVKAMTRETLLDFFHRWYVPNNMTFVVVGDFDAQQALAKVQKAFGGSTERPVERAERREGAQRATRTVVVAQDVKEAQVTFGFHIPGLRHEDTGALDVAAVLLGQGESSRLSREVKRKQQVVTDAYAYSFTPKDEGLLVVGATVPLASTAAQTATGIEHATKATLDEVFRMANEEVSTEELAKAKTIIESDAVYQKETVQGLARKLGFFQMVAGDVTYEDDYQRQVAAVTPAHLRAVVAKYLTPKNLTIAVLVAEKSDTLKTKLSEIAAKSSDKMAKLGAKVAVAGARGDGIVRQVLPNGARLLIRRDTSVPVVAIRAVWNGGVRWEEERNNGINNLLSLLVTRGTHTRGADELAHEIEAMAGSLSGFAGRNSFGVRAELLSRTWERGLDIFVDCLLDPAFPEEEVEREKRQVIEEIHAQEDNLTQVAFRLFSSAFYARHPYRLDALGTVDSVSSLTRRRLNEYYRRHFRADNVTIAIVGDVDPARVIAKLTTLVGTRTAAERPEPTVRIEIPKGGGPRHAFKFLNRAQAHIVLGFPGTTISNKDRFAFELLSTILSGQGGRLFVELREKQALAYRVSAYSLEGVDPGYFAVYIATSPENIDAAVKGIWVEIDRLKSTPVGEEELERAKRYLVGAHEISLQRRSALASTLAFNEAYGLGYDEYQKFSPSILKVTPADLQRVVKKYFVSDQSVMAMVRPEELTPGAARKLRGSASLRVPPLSDSSSSRARIRGRDPASHDVDDIE